MRHISHAFWSTNNVSYAVAVAFICLGIVAGTALPSHGADELSISSAPAADGTIDKDRSRFTYQVEPGQSITDEYYVTNSGTVAQVVSVYASDAYNADDGNFALLDTGVPSVDVGTWVTFDGGAQKVDLTLAPGESRVLSFTVNVPADATPGDHAGGIVVSALTESGQVKLDRRIATRLYVRVKGELQALMTLGSLSANYEPSWNPFGGRVNMVFTLTNSGNVSLGANTVSQVTGIFGIPFSGASKLDVPELLPGTSRTVSIPLEGVGQWMFLTASVDLTGTIDDDAINPGPLPTAKRDVVFFATPWAAIGVLLVGGIVFLWLRGKRRRDAIRAQEWLEFAAAQAAAEAKEQATPAKAKATPATKPATSSTAKGRTVDNSK